MVQSWSRSSPSVFEFQRYEAGNRDSEVELPEDRLQIGQAASFNVAVTEVVKDLIGRTAIAVRDTEEAIHFLNFEIGYAPSANLPFRTQVFERRHNAGEVGNSSWPVQQIQVKM